MVSRQFKQIMDAMEGPPDDLRPWDPDTLEIPEGYLGEFCVYNGVRGLHFTKPGFRTKEKSCIVYIHGGAFQMGSPFCGETTAWLRTFLEELGLDGYAMEYGLAPEHPYPQALNDVYDFYRGLLEQGYEHIIVGGASAGGNLALTLSLLLRSREQRLPDVLYLSSPAVDMLYFQNEIYRPDDQLDFGAGVLDSYVRDADPTDPLVSPVYADMTGMPPMIFTCGGSESMTAGIVKTFEHAARAGIDCVIHVAEGMMHCYAGPMLAFPESLEATQEIVEFLRYHMNMEKVSEQ